MGNKAIRYHLIFPALIFVTLSCAPGSRLQGVRTPEGIEVSDGHMKVLFYQIKPKSLDGKFERASYIHPLYSLSGNVITEDFPDDHRHHHGIYSAWHQILADGELIADGWTGENLSWRVRESKITNRDNSVTIASEVIWQHLNSGRQQPIVQENLKVVVHSSDRDFRMIDYDIELLPLKGGLQIGGSDDEKGYGGFSLRLKLPQDIRFVAKDREVEPQVVSVPAGWWMDFKGSFDGSNAQSGVAVFCHPSNPGSPHPWILREEKSMQNVAFPGRVPVALTKDGLRLRYRMVIHKSELTEQDLEELYQRYAAE